MKIGKDVIIEKDVIIDVKEGFIGDRSIIRSGARIEGTKVILGAESYLDHGALIGGGSCFDDQAYLIAGDWLHMGWNSQINTARGVDIGHEVGIGIETKLFTHGAYLPADKGFPVQWRPIKIGNRVWLPNAWVNPGVIIGHNVVVTARSLVNSDLPQGCLAGGIPAKVIKEHEYPKQTDRRYILHLLDKAEVIYDKVSGRNKESHFWILVNEAIFNLTLRDIHGPVSEKSEILRNQLRRNGIRFRYAEKNGEYKPWKKY